MKFKKSSTLCNFDIFPKVLTEGKKAVLEKNKSIEEKYNK